MATFMHSTAEPKVQNIYLNSKNSTNLLHSVHCAAAQGKLCYIKDQMPAVTKQLAYGVTDSVGDVWLPARLALI